MVNREVGSNFIENPSEAETKAYEEKSKRELIDSEVNDFKKVVVEKFDEAEVEEINSALKLMINLHVDQKDRPDGKPYIIHPLEIASDVVEKYGVTDSNIIVAALLHDAVEDQGLKLVVRRLLREDANLSEPEALIDLKNLEEVHSSEIEEIALREIGSLYGNKVKNIVSGLSNPDFDSLIEKLKIEGVEKTKNELYKEHVAEAVQDQDVCVIKFADFARNALALGNLPEGEKKEKLKKKYGPVITDVFTPLFHAIGEDHPLYKRKEDIIANLKKAYDDQYAKELIDVDPKEKGGLGLWSADNPEGDRWTTSNPKKEGGLGLWSADDPGGDRWTTSNPKKRRT